MAPLGVAALVGATLMPASMYLHGTAMGEQLHAMRSRCFGAFGVIDPWAKALARAGVQQEQYEREILPSLHDRPRDPNALIKGASREQVAHEWTVGVVERTQHTMVAAFTDEFDRIAAERKEARENYEVVRKNRMIQRNKQPTAKEPEEPHRERSFEDDN